MQTYIIYSIKLAVQSHSKEELSNPLQALGLSGVSLPAISKWLGQTSFQSVCTWIIHFSHSQFQSSRTMWHKVTLCRRVKGISVLDKIKLIFNFCPAGLYDCTLNFISSRAFFVTAHRQSRYKIMSRRIFLHRNNGNPLRFFLEILHGAWHLQGKACAA